MCAIPDGLMVYVNKILHILGGLFKVSTDQ